MKSAKRKTQRHMGRAMLLAAALVLCGATAGLAQESVAVRAPMVKGTLPAEDPESAVWNSAPLSQFPMSPQVHWPNRIQEATVKDVKIRALHDGTQVAFLLEYADPTQDPDDAAALEFMVGDKKAHFAHGQPMAQVEGGPVNIWYWKNKDNKAVDMSAMGFGTLKAQAHQDVKAKGVYANGTWKVVFSRPLATEHADEDTQVKPGEFINIAFAVWDGQKDATSGELREKGSQKAVSSWWYFRAEPPADYSGYFYAAVAIALAVGFQFVLIRKLKKGQSA
ncbi:MAG TPA: ethylbenzene dehydrogenase-related protein [Nitrospira sp.]|nr:ethylbenzene dehydrogenase-related protein [Nitrospira sp.]